MDINNEMIRMRKEIKKAKTYIISKLVRKIRQLKNKKGSDVLRQKYLNRTQNLLHDIEVIKDTKPDTIFKFLLSSSLAFEDLNRYKNLAALDRACLRIGTVPFIKNKISAIQEHVNDFNSFRTSKDQPLSLKVAHKLSTSQSSKAGERTRAPSKPNNASLVKKKTLPDELEEEALPDAVMEEALPDELVEEGVLPDLDATDDDESMIDDVHHLGASSDVVDALQRPPATENSRFDSPQGAPTMGDTEHQPAVEEVETFAQTIQHVLPDFYAKQAEGSETKKPFDFSRSKSDDVSDILSNIGAGFSESDCDVTEGDEVEEGEDGFFVSGDGSRKVTNRRFNDEQHRFHVSSTFISSLSDIAADKSYKMKSDEPFCIKKDKKNRLGQRRRKQKRIAESRTESAPPAKKAAKAKKSSAPEELHPSWQASQRRKQQSGIQPFSGKHVRFDDSD